MSEAFEPDPGDGLIAVEHLQPGDIIGWAGHAREVESVRTARGPKINPRLWNRVTVTLREPEVPNGMMPWSIFAVRGEEVRLIQSHAEKETP